MLWSIIKVIFFIGIAVALTFGALWVLDTPGKVTLAFADRTVELTPIAFIIILLLGLVAAWVLLKIAGLLVALLRALAGDETAVSRFFDRTRERRGYEALGEGLLALAAGETTKAQARATRAERLLGKPHLTRVLSAQAAEAVGNTAKAEAVYKDMLKDDRSRLVGVQGLMKQKLEAGETEVALKLAEKAFALSPRNAPIQDALFELQSKKSDWAGARKTLEAKVKNNLLPRDVGKRREAVLAVADARAALDEGNEARARDLAYQANRLAPTFVPAAALAAEMHTGQGEKRVAARILKKAWASDPHPDLAAAFAAIEPEEDPAVRQQRFKDLFSANPTHDEARLTEAELALAAEDFPQARRAIGDLAERAPTNRSLAIMAAIEKGLGEGDAVIRAWLAKAVAAPRSEAWVCGNCNAVMAAWAPTCSNCEAFDTLTWTTPPSAEGEGTAAAAMLPLIVAGLGQQGSDGGRAADDDDVLEGEASHAT